MTELKFENMTAAASGDSQNMLGKLLYFSLPSVLVDKDDLRQLCVDMNIPYAGGNRLSVSDAFRSATGDVRDRIISEEYGERRIYQIYCRDNRRISDSVISRELVKETMHQETNQYEKLANISYDKDSQIFSYDNLAYDSQIDAMAYCRRAEELFELYQRCANRRQVETICVNFLRMLESTKLSVNGHLYFVPRHNMEKVDIFEDFVAELSRLSRNQTHLMANSIYIIDDAKQRQKMTEEFYSAVKKEISEYQERADYFIKSGCQSPSVFPCPGNSGEEGQSPSVMDRWVLKIQSLEGKKQHYEDVLRRELDGLDDDFATLKLLSQELSFRAQAIRAKKAA